VAHSAPKSPPVGDPAKDRAAVARRHAPPPVPAARNHPRQPVPASAPVQLMDSDPACRTPPSHPEHLVPLSGPQPRITHDIAHQDRNLDACRRGADRYATRSNARGRRHTVSSAQPGRAMRRCPHPTRRPGDMRADTIRSSRQGSSGNRSATARPTGAARHPDGCCRQQRDTPESTLLESLPGRRAACCQVPARWLRSGVLRATSL
jgi:hypothetical protein